jgi:hypothetical protein
MPGRRDAARDDELIRYLLGELPEDDVERLDEQSVVDDEFAARLRLAEDDLVDAYSRGKLTGDRQRRFEAFYLTSPRRRDKVAFSRRLLQALDGDPAHAAPGGLKPHWRPRWLPWALAAAAALCLGTGALIQHARIEADLTDARQRLAAADRQLASLSDDLAAEKRAAAVARESLAQAQTPAFVAVALVLTPQTRGTGAVPVIAVAGNSRTVPVTLRVEDANAAPFETELRDPGSNRIVWRSGPLDAERAAPTPLVSVALPADLLKSQHYAIDLYTTKRGRDFVNSYAFEAVRR